MFILKHVGARFVSGWELHQFAIVNETIYISLSPREILYVDRISGLPYHNLYYILDREYSLEEIAKAVLDTNIFNFNSSTELNDMWLFDNRELGELQHDKI